MTHHRDDQEGVVQGHHETVLVHGRNNGEIADVDAASLSIGWKLHTDLLRNDSETHGELNFLGTDVNRRQRINHFK